MPKVIPWKVATKHNIKLEKNPTPTFGERSAALQVFLDYMVKRTKERFSLVDSTRASTVQKYVLYSSIKRLKL